MSPRPYIRRNSRPKSETEETQDAETGDMVLGPDDEETDDDDETESDAEPAAVLTPTPAPTGTPMFKKIEDIFEEIGAPALVEGDLITYNIQRDGFTIGKENHPFSMGELQKKYGPGMYRIVARSNMKGRFVGVQNVPLGAAVKEIESADPAAKAISNLINGTPGTPQAAETRGSSSGPSFKDMVSTIFDVSAQAKKEANDQNSKMMELVMANQRAMIEMMGSSQRSAPAPQSAGSEIKVVMESVDMLARMMKQNMEMMTDSMTSVMKQMRDMQSSPKGSIADPDRVFALLQATKRDALNEFKLMEEIAEKRAASMAGYGSDNDGEEKEGTLESTIKTFLPLISRAIATPEPVAAPMPVAGANPRRELQGGAGGHGSHGSPSEGGASPRGASARGPGQSAQRPQALPINQKTIVIQKKNIKTVNPSEGDMSLTKEKAIEILGSKLPGWLVTRKANIDAAKEAVILLGQAGHTPKEAIELFPTAASFLATCHDHGLPGMADSWLTEFHGCIRSHVEGSGPKQV